MQKNEEIPRQEWIDFLDDFTREYRGRPIELEVAVGDAEPLFQARDLPLQGISADVKRSGEHDVSIIVGNEREPQLTRIIPEARRLVVERSPAGNYQGLEIDAADGSRTLLHFRMLRAA